MELSNGDNRAEESEPDVGADEDFVFKPSDDISMWELVDSLKSLGLFEDDPFLTMQAINLAYIDQWLIGVERKVQQELLAQDRTPLGTFFLSAQTQMWVFGTYELLRTWRQRIKDAIKLVKNGGLQLKIEALEKNPGYTHMGRELRAAQLRMVQNDPKLAKKLPEDLRRTHIPFTRLEFLRVALGKHEVSGRSNMIAVAPGYARIDHLTGSLSYELSNGGSILGYITRRDISDELRAIRHGEEPPTQDALTSFDQFMSGHLAEDL